MTSESTNKENKMKSNEKNKVTDRVADAAALTGVGAVATGAVAMLLADWLWLKILMLPPMPPFPAWAIPVAVAGEVVAVGAIGYRLYRRHKRTEEARRATIAGR